MERSTITTSWNRYEIEMLAETRREPSRSIQLECVVTWAAAGLLVGGFWFGVLSVAWKWIT